LTVSAYDAVLALTPTRALLGYSPLNGHQEGTARSLWWTSRTGKVRVIARAAHGPFPMPHVQAASLHAHAVSVVRGGRQIVLDTRSRRALWSTTGDEAVRTFSPDGRQALVVSGRTQVGEEESDDYVVRQVSVRAARTGEVLATFEGTFDFEDPVSVGTHWETSDVFVTTAYDGVDEGSTWPTPTGVARIRCRVSTASCERVPGSGPAIWEQRVSR
jgi:hypothetical protein